MEGCKSETNVYVSLHKLIVLALGNDFAIECRGRFTHFFDSRVTGVALSQTQKSREKTHSIFTFV